MDCKGSRNGGALKRPLLNQINKVMSKIIYYHDPKYPKVVSKAISKYKYLQEEKVYLEVHDDNIYIMWHVYMDNYISMHRVQQIANFLSKGTNLPIYCCGGYRLAN